MRVLCAADEADGGESVSTGVDALVCGLENAGMGGEAEVIVGAEVKDGATVHSNLSALGTFDDAFVFVEFLGL